MTQRACSNLSGLAQGLASTLLVACLALGGPLHAQAPATAPLASATSGPAWAELTPAQQAALAPLKKD